MSENTSKLDRIIPKGEWLNLAHIAANTATEYFKETFTRKAYDGKPWKPWANTYRHRANGSLMIDSAKLLNSIRPSKITAEKVVIQAGNSKVDYARAHNEGFIGSVTVKPHTRVVKGKAQRVRQHTRNMRLPRRQFMGNAGELQRQLKEDIEDYLRTITK